MPDTCLLSGLMERQELVISDWTCFWGIRVLRSWRRTGYVHYDYWLYSSLRVIGMGNFVSVLELNLQLTTLACRFQKWVMGSFSLSRFPYWSALCPKFHSQIWTLGRERRSRLLSITRSSVGPSPKSHRTSFQRIKASCAGQEEYISRQMIFRLGA